MSILCVNVKLNETFPSLDMNEMTEGEEKIIKLKWNLSFPTTERKKN